MKFLKKELTLLTVYIFIFLVYSGTS